MTRAERRDRHLYRKGMRCGAKGHWPKMLEAARSEGWRKPYNYAGEVLLILAHCRECRRSFIVERRISAHAAAVAIDLRGWRAELEADAWDALRRGLTRGDRW